MEKKLLKKKYSKGQVIEGLYAYFSGFSKYLSNDEKTQAMFPEHKKAPKEFSSKIKKILDLDRIQNTEEYIFFETEGVGQGGQEYFNDFQVVLIGFAVDSLYKGFKQSEVLWVTQQIKEHMFDTFVAINKDKQTLIKEHGASYYGDDIYTTVKFHREKLNNLVYLVISNFEISSPEKHNDLRRIRYEFTHAINEKSILNILDKNSSCTIFDFVNLSLVAPQIVSETPAPRRGRPAKD